MAFSDIPRCMTCVFFRPGKRMNDAQDGVAIKGDAHDDGSCQRPTKRWHGGTKPANVVTHAWFFCEKHKTG